MAGAGLQCWDASGKLIVDLGDYMCRYLGTVSIAFSGSVKSVTVNFAGVTTNGSFAAITNTDYGSTQVMKSYAINSYYVRCSDGKLTAYYMPGTISPKTTLSVQVYSFI